MDFIVPEANFVPLLIFVTRIHFAKFHFHLMLSFPQNTGLSTDILFIKLELYNALGSKNSIPDWHLFITQMEMKWTELYAMILHVITY